ncbi:MAG: hypothetical protein K2X25_03785 [Caulobacteraceae bacterium]|nr:hypothetical protein [Caulobacteraceae bacterium]
MIRLITATTAVLLLAACNAPEPASAPDSAPVSPLPPADPAPVADNVLTAEGLGPIRIGMTASEVAAAWGPTATPDAVGGPEPEVCSEYHPARAPYGVNVMIQNGRLTRITLIRDSDIRTDRGFGLGDAGAAIKAAYGGAIIAQPDKYAPAPAEDLIAWSRGGSTAYVEDPAARGIRYQINGEGVAHIIHAGDPSIQLVEGCS